MKLPYRSQNPIAQVLYRDSKFSHVHCSYPGVTTNDYYNEKIPCLFTNKCQLAHGIQSILLQKTRYWKPFNVCNFPNCQFENQHQKVLCRCCYTSNHVLPIVTLNFQSRLRKNGGNFYLKKMFKPNVNWREQNLIFPQKTHSTTHRFIVCFE